LKKLLVPKLLELGLTPFAQKINVESTTYGPTAVAGVRKFQEAKKLQVDGCVGKNTWAALGVNEPVVGGPKPGKAAELFGGQVVIAPGANLPGQEIEAMTLEFIAQMAADDREADHGHDRNQPQQDVGQRQGLGPLLGHACDIGMFANGGADDSPVGDRIMEAACLLAGDSKEGARSKATGRWAVHVQPQQPADSVHLEDLGRRQPPQPRPRRGSPRVMR
jgi:hypothetical protein